MKPKSIIMKAHDVQAILRGDKTQFRVPMKPQPIDSIEIDGNFYHGNHKGYIMVDGHPNWRQQFAFEFSPYQPGQIVYVRETWMESPNRETAYKKPLPPFKYRASASEQFNEEWPGSWRSSATMPQSAARIWLQVESVRVERLQDIENSDCIAEGVELKGENWRNYHNAPGFMDTSIIRFANGETMYAEKASFKTLWEHNHGAESWDANPWVWAVTFRILSTTGKPEIAQEGVEK